MATIVMEPEESAPKATIVMEDEPTSAAPAAIVMEPEAAPAKEGSVFNNIKETVGSIIVPAFGALASGAEKVANVVTGTSEQQAQDAAQQEAEARLIKLPDIPDNGAKRPKFADETGKPTIPKYLPGYAEVIKAKDRVDQAGDIRSLTANQKKALEQDKLLVERFTRIAGPLPQAPKHRNSGIGGMTAYITDAEIGAIANQFNVDPGIIMSMLSVEGGQLESTKEQTAAGEGDKAAWAGLFAGLADSAGFGLGKYINRATQDPNTRRAIEEVRGLLQQRQGKGRVIAEIVPGLMTGVGTGALVTRAAGMGAKMAATAGLTSAANTASLAKTMAIGGNLVDAALEGATYSIAETDLGQSKIAAGIMGAAIALPAVGLFEGALVGKKALGEVMDKTAKHKLIVAMAAQPTAYEQAASQALTTAPQKAGQLISDLSTNKLDNPDLLDLAKRIGGKGMTPAEAAEFVKIKISQEPKIVQESMTHLETERNFQQIVSKQNAAATGFQWAGRFFDMLSSAPNVAAVYDKKYGTNGMQTLDLLATEGHLSNAMTDALLKKFEPVREQLINMQKLTGKDEKELMQLVFDHMNTPGQKAATSPRMQKLVTDYSKYMENVRQFFNKSGNVNVAKLTAQPGQVYVPNRLLRGTERIMALEETAEKAGILKELQGYGAVGGSNAAPMPTGIRQALDQSEITRGLEILEGRAPGSMTDDELVTAFKKHTNLTRPSGNGFLESASEMRTIAALQARQKDAKLPDFLMDKNLMRVTGGYIQDLANMTYIEPHLRNLEHLGIVANKVGDQNMSKFYTNLVKDLAYGGQEGAMPSIQREAFNRVEVWGRTKARSAKNPLAKATYEMLATMPADALAHLRTQMYSNFLGIHNLKAPIENLAQPLVMGMPELGAAYGASTAVRAMPSIPRMLSSVHTGMVMERPEEIHRILRGELARQGLKGKALDTVTNTSLALFNASEKTSRAWVMGMSEVVAEDILQGKAGGLNFVRGMSGTYGKSVEKAIQSGNKELVQSLVSNYMLGRISLNYGAAASAEFGRMMGPMLSSFTRWPTEMIGKTNYAIRGEGLKGVGKLAKAHGGMVAAFFLADATMQQQDQYNNMWKESGRAQVLAGSGGLAKWAPYNSLIQSASGYMGGSQNSRSLYSSPVWEAGSGLAMGALGVASGMAQDDEAATARALTQLRRGADTMVDLSVPGTSFYHLATRTIPMLVDDQPRKRGMIARNQEGL